MSACRIIALGVAFTLLAAVPTFAQEIQKPNELNTEFLCQLKAYLVKPPQMVGAGSHGTRMIYHVTGGWVKGPKISGEVLPGPADWLLIRPDGALELDVRVTVRTDDGHLIYVQYRGLVLVAPEVMERIDKGESVNRSEYYFRTTPIFETGAERYRWLNQVISVGVGTIGRDFVSYDIFAIR
jgi:hypothetical protein